MTLIRCAGRRLQVVKQQHTQGMGASWHRAAGAAGPGDPDQAAGTPPAGGLLEVVRLEGRPYQFLYREGVPSSSRTAWLFKRRLGNPMHVIGASVDIRNPICLRDVYTLLEQSL